MKNPVELTTIALKRDDGQIFSERVIGCRADIVPAFIGSVGTYAGTFVGEWRAWTEPFDLGTDFRTLP